MRFREERNPSANLMDNVEKIDTSNYLNQGCPCRGAIQRGPPHACGPLHARSHLLILL